MNHFINNIKGRLIFFKSSLIINYLMDSNQVQQIFFLTSKINSKICLIIHPFEPILQTTLFIYLQSFTIHSLHFICFINSIYIYITLFIYIIILIYISKYFKIKYELLKLCL